MRNIPPSSTRDNMRAGNGESRKPFRGSFYDDGPAEAVVTKTERRELKPFTLDLLTTMEATDTRDYLSYGDTETRRFWVKLLMDCARDHGAAAQTLGGLLAITNTETFVPVETIAAAAWLPLGTVRKHLKALQENGWVNNLGRQRTQRCKRRTCTWRLTKQALDLSRTDYAVLPTWMCFDGGLGQHGYTWSTRLVFALIMERLMSLRSGLDHGRSEIYSVDDLADLVLCYAGDDRFLYSMTYLMNKTGLSDRPLRAAKRELATLGLIRRDSIDAGDLLVPNFKLKVRYKTSPGVPFHMVTFEPGERP